MARLEKLSATSWRQPLIDRKSEFHLWGSHKEVADHCELKDGTKRLLRIKFPPELHIDVIDNFQITSGREISFPKHFREAIIPIIKANPSSFFDVFVLDASDKNELEEAQTETLASIKVRLTQQKFRADLLDYWKACAVTGLTIEGLLKASHIRPWKNSDSAQRQDKFNGLLLSAALDALFDRGYITFSDEGVVIKSKALVGSEIAAGLPDNAKLNKFDNNHKKYFAYHRTHVFKK